MLKQVKSMSRAVLRTKYWVLGLIAGALLLAARAQVVQQAQPLAAIQPITQAVPLGPTLDVIPIVSADGYTIQLTLIPTITEFLGYDEPGQFQTVVGSVAAPVPLPRFRYRYVVTSSIIWDGQTVVLGGLISETVTKTKDRVPVLGDLPLIGRLFRSEAKDSQKKNLVIFTTATIVDPAGNRVNDPNNLPYDPNKIPPQVPFAPVGPVASPEEMSKQARAGLGAGGGASGVAPTSVVPTGSR